MDSGGERLILPHFQRLSSLLSRSTIYFPACNVARFLFITNCILSMSETWMWDSGRDSYYYWSQEEDCFVYQTGLKLDRNNQIIDEYITMSRQPPSVELTPK